MSATFSERAALLQKARRALRRNYGKTQMTVAEDVAWQLLRIILVDDTPESVVDQAMARIESEFVDLNELRVSLAREVVDVLPQMAMAHEKAVQVLKLFNEIFLNHNSMDWDFIRAMGVREMRQYFENINGGSPQLAAAAVMSFSGGHAVPATGGMRRVLERLETVEAEDDAAAVQGFMERAVTREQGYETWALLRQLAFDVCAARSPQCGKCVLSAMCPTGQKRLAAAKVKSKKTKAGAKSSKKAAKAKSKAGKTAAKAKAKSGARKKTVTRKKTAKKAAKKKVTRKAAKKK